MTQNGKRQINPRSLENLKLGAEARNRDKVRRNTTLLPESIQWLEAHGNVSFMIDTLVAAAKKGELKLNSGNTHERNISSDAHDVMPDLEVNADIKPIKQWGVFCQDHRGKERFSGAYFTEYEANDRVAKLRREAHASASMGDHPYVPPDVYEVRKCLIAPVSQQQSNRAHDSIADPEARELRSRLEQAEKLAKDQRLEIERLQSSINAHERNCAELRSQMEEQKLEIEQLRQLEKDGAEQLAQEVSCSLKAATILKGALRGHSLNLEGNVGGKLRNRIQQALKLIDDI